MLTVFQDALLQKYTWMNPNSTELDKMFITNLKQNFQLKLDKRKISVNRIIINYTKKNLINLELS